MRIECTYYADDGTEFDNEAECLAYEKNLNSLWDSVVLLDEKFRDYSETQFDLTMLEFAEQQAVYVKVLDVRKAKELFNWIYEQYGFSLPPVDMLYGGCIFKYDETAKEDWIDLTKQYREIATALERVEKAVASVG